MARQISEFNRQRIAQGYKIRELKKSAKNVIQAQFQRLQFGIGYYTTKDLQKRGASELDILKYYEREQDLLTGKYTIDRNLIAKNNYLSEMRNANINEDIINRVDKILDPFNIKDFRKAFRMLPTIRSYYYKDGSKEETEELVNNTLDIIDILDD